MGTYFTKRAETAPPGNRNVCSVWSLTTVPVSTRVKAVSSAVVEETQTSKSFTDWVKAVSTRGEILIPVRLGRAVPPRRMVAKCGPGSSGVRVAQGLPAT